MDQARRDAGESVLILAGIELGTLFVVGVFSVPSPPRIDSGGLAMVSRSDYRENDALCLNKYEDCLHKLILDLAHVGVLVTDANGDIKYLNPTYARMFGLDIKAALTKNINDYFPNSKLMDVMKTGVPDKAVEFSFKGQDALINRYPIIDDGVTMGGFIEVYFRDIRELQKLMRKMNNLQKKVLYYKRKSQGLPGAKYTFDDIIGESAVIKEFKKLGMQFARSSMPVLIMGESGSGKELVAHAIHSASPRAGEAFVRVNCAAIPKDLLESELFGFEEGTFTGAKSGGSVGKFELADRGTIFLDEIAELPLDMQAKLLRVLESGEIQKIGTSELVFSDFRLVAATNKDLAASVAKGSFREDLYHRLHILVLKIPPLRERPEDIPILAQHVLNTTKEGPSNLEIKFANEVKQLLKSYLWPGNIRELRNVLSFAVFSLDEGLSEIRLRNLPPYMLESGVMMVTRLKAAPSPLSQAREKSEKEALILALETTDQNKVKAARLLGISRNELYRKMRKYGLLSQIH
jgi:transcriptional regulator with PAS, ATPase and Fis domain